MLRAVSTQFVHRESPKNDDIFDFTVSVRRSPCISMPSDSNHGTRWYHSMLNGIRASRNKQKCCSERIHSDRDNTSATAMSVKLL